MKKLLMLLLLVVLLLGGVLLYLTTNLDSIAKRAIETAGSDTLGTPVRVESVDIDLAGGTATLSGFSVANPPGFSDQDMMRFDELRVAVDLASLRDDVLRINSITSVNPYVLYEVLDEGSNIDALRSGLGASEPAPDESSSPDKVIAIDEIRINGIQGSLQSPRLPRAVHADLGDVSLPPVEGTSQQLAMQIVRPLLSQLAGNASSAMRGAVVNAVQDELTERAGEQLERAGEQIREAGDNLRERLGL